VGPQGDPGPTGAAGADGLGFTGGSYNASTGVVTFTSDDGLGFTTGDLRGATGSVSAASTLNLTEQGSTPSTPSSGTWELYAKADGIYSLDDAGSETQLGVTSVAFADLTSTPTTLAGYGITDAAPKSPSINAQTGTTYTLVLGDAHGIVTMDNAGANTLTIPTNASVAFPTGTVIEVWQLGAGSTTIEADTGVTLNGVSAGGVALGAAYAPATLRKIGTDAWLIAVGGAASVA